MPDPLAYREQLLAVEPSGAERIAPADRHGRPTQLLWTWASPNFEFTTVFVGVLAAGVWRLSFWQATGAVAFGNGLAAVAHGLLSARGPKHGSPQMVLSRLAFGKTGNAVPATIMALTSGVGWFAASSVSGTFALVALTGLHPALALALIVLAQITLAFFGHNLVQAFERWAFPVLFLVFALVSANILWRALPATSLSSPLPTTSAQTAGWLLAVGASFGYAAGWTPYAADYTRYLPRESSRAAVGLCAGLGLFLSCTALEAVGAASVTLAAPGQENPAQAFVDVLPQSYGISALGACALAAFVVGSAAANTLNLYSAALAVVSLWESRSRWARATAVGSLGLAGWLVAWAAQGRPAQSYESFLLLVSYWVGPWLGVVFTDQLLSRGTDVDALLYDRQHRNRAGLAAFLIALPVSVLLFADQQAFTGAVPRALPVLGDITFFVGFILAAGVMRGLAAVNSQRRAA